MKFPIVIQSNREDLHLDADFSNKIILHVYKNSLDTKKFTPPIFLAIQGPKGEGKTFQTIEICVRNNIVVIPISSSILNGPNEGSAVEVFKSVYLYACTIKKEQKRNCVIVIDDFHLSIVAHYDRTEKTINSQLLTGFMMNLSDNPKICGVDSIRIPIILIGNNFQNIHSPLTRHGRMNFIDWIPDKNTKFQMVEKILKKWIDDFTLEHFEDFFNRYSELPISFFSEIKNDIIDNFILEQFISGTTSLDIISREVDNCFNKDFIKIPMYKIEQIAKQRADVKQKVFEQI